MTEPDADYRKITAIVFVGLLCSVFLLPGVVAVTTIVLTLTGLGLNRLSRQYNSQRRGWPQRRVRWERGKCWW